MSLGYREEVNKSSCLEKQSKRGPWGALKGQNYEGKKNPIKAKICSSLMQD